MLMIFIFYFSCIFSEFSGLGYGLGYLWVFGPLDCGGWRVRMDLGDFGDGLYKVYVSRFPVSGPGWFIFCHVARGFARALQFVLASIELKQPMHDCHVLGPKSMLFY